MDIIHLILVVILLSILIGVTVDLIIKGRKIKHLLNRVKCLEDDLD